MQLARAATWTRWPSHTPTLVDEPVAGVGNDDLCEIQCAADDTPCSQAEGDE